MESNDGSGEANSFLKFKHIRKSNFPGNTMCGLNEFRDGKFKYARNRADSDCKLCDEAVERSIATHPKKWTAESRARQKEFLGKRDWRP